MPELEEVVGQLRAALEAAGAPVVSVAGNPASNTIFVYLRCPFPDMPRKIGAYKVYRAVLWGFG